MKGCCSSWAFLWTPLDEVLYGKDRWKVRVYKRRSLLEACSSMADFLSGRAYDVVLDYEAFSVHEGKNIDLNGFDNPLRDGWL